MENEKQALPSGYILSSPRHTFRIISVIGRGGFGITYKAEAVSPSGSGFFAIKELFIAEYSERKEDSTVEFSAKAAKAVASSESDFIREATMLNRLGTHHPNIVKVHEVFHANNTAYYAMDFLEGITLQDYIKQKGPQPIKWALRLLAPLFDALECLHANKMTHLDIKPGNIIMVQRGGRTTPVLIDFGLSKHYDDEGNSTSLINNVACSKGYAPLEQYAGLSTFTPQADVYALAATLFFCLTGTAPEIASDLNPKNLRSALPDELPEQAVLAIMQAMRKSKEHRTQSIEKFRSDLAKYMPTGERKKPVIIDAEIVEADVVEPQGEPEKKKAHPEKKVPAAPRKRPANHVKHKKKASPVKWIVVALSAAVAAFGIFWYISWSDPTRRISKAIRDSDAATLAVFAEMDSIRAMIPLAKLEFMSGNLAEAASLVSRIDRMGATTDDISSLKKKIAEKAASEFNDFVAANIPGPYDNVDESVLEAGIALREEADSICSLMGMPSECVSRTFDTQLRRAYYRWVSRGDNSYDRDEMIRSYSRALDFKDDSNLRKRIERLQ